MPLLNLVLVVYNCKSTSSRSRLSILSSTIELSMYAKLIFSLAVITVAALFSAGSAEAAKGPKITHKVYFDIKHGDKNLGRSAFLQLSLNFFLY